MSGPGSPAGEVVRLTVEGVGGLGDGLARHRDIPVYVPLAAPGDIADVLIGSHRGDGVAGRLMALVRGGAARRAPPCPHFGECGGCAVQHLTLEVYGRWKANLVGDALAGRGLDAEIRPMQSPAPNDPLALRRRALFAAERRENKVAIGFNARATHKIVPIGNCLLLTPALNRLLGVLPELMNVFLANGERGQAAVTDLPSPAPRDRPEAGPRTGSAGFAKAGLGGAIDILVVGPRVPTRRTRERIAGFASDHRIARISWRMAKKENAVPEPIVSREPCRIPFGGAAVEFPPGGFLQPSAWGEATLQRLVIEGMGEPGKIAELFAGIGTFAFVLAAQWGRGGRWKLAAHERDAALAGALRQGANRAGLSGKLSVETRDLDRRPLLADEIAGLDGVILDPPRTGAKAQCEILARAPGPNRAVMVSCNPATFARDARILVAGGWALKYVTPVDQFLYSAHLELVAVFSRSN